ncbi:rod shape-determining protein MreC [Marmoricola sp. RAF53]|uniref:rod shape-determining protein MreC n=1 Tax=Marmoricola sp. RAF53 TaxID=3233059 RepID=UPI003F9DA685
MKRFDSGRRPGRDSPGRVLALLVLASVTVMTLDAKAGDASPVDGLRSAVGNVVGPVETAADGVARPFTSVKAFFRTNDSLRADVSRLEADNARLRSARATDPLDRKRLAALDGLTRTVAETGYSLVAARVVAMGPLQSFSRTVTIDAGTSAGVRKDMTVLNNDGLVGRVVRATRSTATVLLVVDRDSVVGGRLGSNLEIGFLRGRGSVGDGGRLELDLVDNAVMPAKDDVVVTWGSENGVPYVAGIPIGTVTSVVSSPRQSSRRAVIKPFVNFSALDVVGVVVPKGTRGDRPVVAAGGVR